MFSEKIPNEQSSAKDDSVMIDSPDSIHEKEADDFAMNVIHGDQLMGGGSNDETIKMKGAKTGEKGMIAPDKVKEEIERTKGNGDPLPGDAKHLMKGQAGGDLDDVHIHTDSHAAKLSKAMEAKAFTYGKDIYFGQGEYETYTSKGKELLAHELAHTRQDSQMIQRAPQTSLWGEFNDKYFIEKKGKKKKWGRAYGAEMIMEFKPNNLVDAKEIGMVQISKEYEKGPDTDGPVYLDETEEKQSIQEIDADENKKLNTNEEGFQVDQLPKKVNPLYAVNKAESGQSLKDAETSKGYGRHGWRYTDDLGVLQERNAVFGDAPTAPVYNDITEAGMIFEATAVAIDGKQEGTYYGSVTWGWKFDPTGYSLIPMKLISDGAVSTTFLKAAQMWNNSTNSKGKPTIDLPVPVFYETTEAADFYGGDTFSASSGVSIPAPLRVQKLEPGTPVKEMPNLIRVKVIEGDFAGISGWIDITKLKKEDITVHPYEEKKNDEENEE